MAEDSDLEKTEPATSRRIEQARAEGQVPRSREIGAFLVLMVSAATFWYAGPWMMQRISGLFRRGLIVDLPLVREPQLMLVRFADISFDAVLALLPFFVALVVASLASPFFLGSWNFSPKALVPDITRLDPIKGISRLISWSGLVELLKAIAKSFLVGGVAIWVMWSERNDIMAIFGQSVDVGLATGGHIVNYSFLIIVCSMVFIVAADVPYQLWQYYDNLKMSKDEVKQEGKEMEGSPEVKGRIRQLQREAARKRMMGAVPTADVIVTNPTHFAVALAYKSGMGAPKVIAKGMGEIALKIRQIGADAGVPMLEAPPLARALYRHTDIDQEIPTALYAAVAEVLAYVYQLVDWRKVGGTYPKPPREIAVPQELVPEMSHG